MYHDFTTRDQDSDQRPDFGEIVDELIEIADTLPDSKHTEVGNEFALHAFTGLCDVFYLPDIYRLYSLYYYFTNIIFMSYCMSSNNALRYTSVLCR